MDDSGDERVEDYRRRFRAACGVDEALPAFAFGDSPEMADELAGLVIAGPKRATAGMLAEFEREDEPLPQPGQHWIVLDGRGEPRCVIRTDQIRTAPLSDVDPAFAWDEGEGDRSLEWWLDVHRQYFRRQCATLGVAFNDELAIIFERFSVVWPDPDHPSWLVGDSHDGVRGLRHDERDWVREHVTSRWGSALVVSRGTVHAPERLPGLVAERDGQRVGLLTFRPRATEAEVVTVDALTPGSGVGWLLLRGIDHLARDQGWSRLWLIQPSTTTPAPCASTSATAGFLSPCITTPSRPPGRSSRRSRSTAATGSRCATNWSSSAALTDRRV